ncbi:MAG: hypothetical protein AAFN05_03380, partial [Pseudomonadota bacterium]
MGGHGERSGSPEEAANAAAEALEAARIASAEAQGRENLARFLDYGGGYSPGTVRARCRESSRR